MKKIILFALLITSQFTSAQLVAFSGKNSNPDDNFAFVALQEIASGTVIFFTNKEWDNTTGTFLDDGEGTLLFVSTETIPVGKVIEITEPNDPGDTFIVSSSGIASFVPGSSWSPTSADPHYAFAASNQSSPTNTVTEVYAFMDTRAGVQVGGTSDPGIGVNASPSAIICDWTLTQAVSIDYDLDRFGATIASLEECTDSVYLSDTLIPVSLEDFVFDGIFRNSFESN
ncbi:MAG: hypothetical protein R3E90_03390 [Marinicella sp.]|nr:hypothetical protein [Xanthomonadales bacterium]